MLIHHHFMRSMCGRSWTKFNRRGSELGPQARQRWCESKLQHRHLFHVYIEAGGAERKGASEPRRDPSFQNSPLRNFRRRAPFDPLRNRDFREHCERDEELLRLEAVPHGSLGLPKEMGQSQDDLHPIVQGPHSKAHIQRRQQTPFCYIQTETIMLHKNNGPQIWLC